MISYGFHIFVSGFYTNLSCFSMIVRSCHIFFNFSFFWSSFYFFNNFGYFRQRNMNIQEACFWSPKSNFHFSQWFSYDFICLLNDFAWFHITLYVALIDFNVGIYMTTNVADMTTNVAVM